MNIAAYDHHEWRSTVQMTYFGKKPVVLSPPLLLFVPLQYLSSQALPPT
jgi:hypothetical protein